MATKNFFDNDIDQVIIKPNLRLVRYSADFINILEVSEFPIGLYCGWHIKSTVDPKNLKFDMKITWVNTIAPPKKCCHSNKPYVIEFSARITQRIHIL